MAEQAKSTDVNADVAIEKIKTIDSLDELEAYIAEENEADEPRKTVLKAYEDRKEELSAPAEEADSNEADSEAEAEEVEQVVSVSKKSVKLLARGCAQRLEAVKAMQGNGAQLNHLDQAFADATARLQKLAGGKGKKAELPLGELQGIVNAIAHKANDDQEKRGLMQPSADQKALMEAREAAEELDL